LNIVAKIKSGANYLQSGNLQLAEKFFNDALMVSPRHPDAIHLLGVVASRKGNNKEAIRLIRKAIKLRPKVGARSGLTNLHSRISGYPAPT